MVVKHSRNKDRVELRIKKRMTKGFSPNSYEKVLNPKDFNDLAILFEDLDLIMGSPIEKAYFKYKQNKGQDFFI